MRVLLIEDDSATAQSIALMLRSDGHVCDIADLGTLRNLLTELEWAEGGEKKCRFKT